MNRGSQDGQDKTWKFRTAGVCSVERAFWGKLQIQLAIFPKAFWRDSKGNEVDLLIESGSDVMPVEIKSGATISDDFFKELRSFSARLATPPIACSLVYGGSERQQRSNVAVWRVGDVCRNDGDDRLMPHGDGNVPFG